jgi:hypothetical protein
MHKIQGLMLCLMVTYSLTYAQEVRKKGFIVLNNSDTAHGWIGVRPWRTNPAQIHFWKDAAAGGMPDTFRLQDLTSFEVLGYDTYTRAILPPNTIRNLAGDPDPGIHDAVKSDSAFLRLLIRGNRLSLWEYSSVADLFFISEAKDSFELLVNEQPDENQAMPKFKAQLASYIQKYQLAEKLERPLIQAGYDEHDLSALIQTINEPAGAIYTAPAIKKSIFSWFAGAGSGISKLSTTGDADALGTFHFNFHFMPLITTGVDFSSMKDLSKLVLRMQLTLAETIYDGYAASPTTSIGGYDYHILQWNITPSLSLLYHFTTRETNRVYAGAGIAYNYSSYAENYLYESLQDQTIRNYIPLSKGWLSGSLLAGIRLDHRWEIACSGQLFGSFSQSPYALTPRTFLVGLYYHLQ